MHIARMHCAHCKDALCTLQGCTVHIARMHCAQGFARVGGMDVGFLELVNLFYCIHLDMVLYIMAVVYGIRQYSPLACLLD